MDSAPFFPEVAEGPKNVQSFWVITDDNIRIRVAHWPKTHGSRGTVFIFQGRTENVEKYGRAVQELHNTGFDAFALDWRGQGLSDRLTKDRMMGHVERFTDYQLDVEAFLRAAHDLQLPKPWFLFGHSLGACIGLRALIEGLPVSACAFSAPLWGINLSTIQRFAAWPVAWAAQAVGRGARYAPGTRGESYVLNTEFADNRLTHDPDMYQYYQSVSENLEEQQIGGPSLGWLFQALSESKRLATKSSPNTPCLTFCGDQDSIVDIRAVKERMSVWPRGQLTSVEGARHDVLYETPDIRERAFGAMIGHFDRHSLS